MRLILIAVLIATLCAQAAAQGEIGYWTGYPDNVHAGTAVAGVGDLNGDGLDDWAMGTPDAGSESGLVIVISGTGLSAIRSWNGTGPFVHLGHSVACAGDVDGDGINDIIAGEPRQGVIGGGAARVFSGASGAPELFFFRPGQSGDDFGWSVDGAGDVNNDGVPDLVVGAPEYDSSFGPFSTHEDAGRAYIYSGDDGSLIGGSTSLTDDSHWGWSVAGAGDVDNDGWADVAIGSPDYLIGGAALGRVSVVSGQSGAALFSVNGTVAGNQFGYDVDGAGDTNGDGFDDLIVGEPNHNFRQGRARVLLGPTGTLGISSTGTFFGDELGHAVTGMGDVDKDGFDDFAAGAPHPGFDVGWNGFVRVVSGVDGASLEYISGSEEDDDFGWSLDTGDFDGDGWRDLLVGSPTYDGLFGPNEGMSEAWHLLHKQPDLGLGGPGGATLSMYGRPLATGGQADLALHGAAPDRPAWLVLSLGFLPVPFKGGTLGPDPAVGLILGLVTDAAGDIVITGLPGGGGPATLYWQYVISDPAQNLGFALSNVVGAEFLP